MYTPDEILEIFYKNHHGIIKEMKDSDHNSSDQLNPYHMEGDVWSHTMSVFTYAVSQYFPMEVQFAALLHDIGKPPAREIKMSASRGMYPRFSGHEGLSFYMAVEVLQSYDLTDVQKANILELVASHSHLFNVSKKETPEKMYAGRPEFYKMLIQLVESDTMGRVSTVENRERSLIALNELKQITVNDLDEKDGKLPLMTLMIGPPGSGKSTMLNNINKPIISRDDCVMVLGETNDYNKNWNTVDQKEVDELFTKTLFKQLKMKTDFIVDKTHMSKKSRRAVIAAARNAGFNVEIIVVTTSVPTILKRNESRDKKIKTDIIQSMIKSFYFPTAMECDKITVYFNE